MTAFGVGDRLFFNKPLACRYNKANGLAYNIKGGGGETPVVFDQNFASLYGGYAGNLSGAPFTVWTVVEANDIQVNSVDGVIQSFPDAFTPAANRTGSPGIPETIDTTKPHDVIMRFSWFDPGLISSYIFVAPIGSPFSFENSFQIFRSDPGGGVVYELGVNDQPGPINVTAQITSPTSINTLIIASGGVGNGYDLILNSTLVGTGITEPGGWSFPYMELFSGDDATARIRMHQLRINGFL